jgi:hypothetical protein
VEDKKIRIEIVREYTEEQIIGMKDYQWENEVTAMRDEANEQLKAQGGNWFDYIPTMYNELNAFDHLQRLRLVVKHKKELVRP